MLSRPYFWEPQHGYTLIEMIIVAAIIMVGSAVALPVSMRMVQAARGDSALAMASTFFETARNRAVAERRNMVLTFVSDNSVVVERVEVPSGALTVVDTLLLEGEHTFTRADLPDTPDLFGGVGAISFTGGQPVMFTSDGSLIDVAGDVTNGTIFITKPGAPDQSRAVAIWGVTGLLRTWKWTGSEWRQ